MAKTVKRVGQAKKLPAKQPVANATDRASSKTGKSIFDRADAGNRRLGTGK